MTTEELDEWGADFFAFCAHFDDVVGRKESRTQARKYLRGLLSPDSGCRASEFLALNVGDVDMQSGAVKIRLGKGRKDRFAFLGIRAWKALNRYFMQGGTVGPQEPLWLAKTPNRELTGERLNRSGLRWLLDRLGQKASVEHCTPHTFRRTMALWSLRAGMNIYALQQIMGHSDLTVLRRYLALVEQDLQDAHRLHGAVDNML